MKEEIVLGRVKIPIQLRASDIFQMISIATSRPPDNADKCRALKIPTGIQKLSETSPQALKSLRR